jgi:muramidase (phage lysozyme)
MPGLFWKSHFLVPDFPICLQGSTSQLPQIAIRQVTDTFILKGINGASIGHALSVIEDVWAKLGRRENASSQKKLLPVFG